MPADAAAAAHDGGAHEAVRGERAGIHHDDRQGVAHAVCPTEGAVADVILQARMAEFVDHRRARRGVADRTGRVQQAEAELGRRAAGIVAVVVRVARPIFTAVVNRDREVGAREVIGETELLDDHAVEAVEVVVGIDRGEVVGVGGVVEVVPDRLGRWRDVRGVGVADLDVFAG